ncbi:hypothetical protein CPB85DRAFT_1261205 [Mucidula mucida]|nr:hypothetical protein CPB85DRAFT_1261205 [Mucidula mucida]
MLQQLSSGILYAIGFFLSVWFNLRHTEDATHPLWTMYLLYLCGIKNIGILIPTPQFRLYVTHNIDNLHGTEQPESISAASATLTAALPRGSWEVIPDFCILLPRAVLKNPQRRMSMNSFLESINMTTSLPTHEIRIVSTAVPLLAELKHAPSRHPADIEAYRDDIMKLIPPAQGQVMAQADCLFCSPKFRDTNAVMLIAAAGDWWTF